MLHMTVMTHGPDTCAAVKPESGEMARNAMDQMDEVSEKYQIDVKGTWTDSPRHTFYMVVDAPNAHAVSKFMWELRFPHWNTVRVFPVVTIEEAMKLAT
jgi:hypothetical protein